jgi:hypothetical protein
LNGRRHSREEHMLTIKVAADVFVAVAMSLALARALEYPGKMRLDPSTYVAIQPIYYPAFAIGSGIGEGLGMILTFVLLVTTPSDSDQFNWIAAAFASLLAMQAIYWTVTHPARNFLAERTRLGARRFFGLSAIAQKTALNEHEKLWPQLRQRWEVSNIVRAFFGFVSVVTIAVGVST